MKKIIAIILTLGLSVSAAAQSCADYTPGNFIYATATKLVDSHVVFCYSDQSMQVIPNVTGLAGGNWKEINNRNNTGIYALCDPESHDAQACQFNVGG